MKTMKRSYGMMILLAAATVFTYAENRLEVVRTAANALEIQLANSDEIFGVQFSLRSSSDIVLGETERSNRTTENHWIVASYRPNDSTVNVLILSMERRNFAAGSGPVVRIPYSTANSAEISYALLTNVMITNGNADSLGVAINNLNWNNKSALLANNSSKSFELGQNYPNPFNPSTKIAYKLNKPAQVRLSVYDIAGREVNRLVDQYQGAGEYNIEWNSSNNQKLASGMYVAYLSVNKESVSRKMVLAK